MTELVETFQEFGLGFPDPDLHHYLQTRPPCYRAAILTYTFLKYTLSLCTKVYLILGVCTKVYLKNLATLDADTKVYLE